MSKKIIVVGFSVLVTCLTSFAQFGKAAGPSNDFRNTVPSSTKELSYNVTGTYKRPILREKLNNAKLIGDVIDGYPCNWITEYISVEILATCSGKTMKAVSRNQVLSLEQKNILKTVDLGTHIVINVNYIHKDAVTKETQAKKIDVTMMVIPEVQAEYNGGYDQLMVYLKGKSKGIITGKKAKDFDWLIIRFTINEAGEVTNTKVNGKSKDEKIEKQFIEVIKNMPKWTPAENSKGVKVKQEFEFSVGNYGC